MFKKIKKNVSKIEFSLEQVDLTLSPLQDESGSAKQPRQRVMFDEDFHEFVVSKRIRLIPNVPHNAKPVNSAKDEVPRDYSSIHLMDLQASNQKDNIDAREHMSHHPISDEDPTVQEYEQVRSYMDEQLDIVIESDDDSVKEITQKVLKQKQQTKKDQEFISFNSKTIDQNWTQNTDNRRIPVVGPVKNSMKGEYDSLPSGSEDEEFQSFEQSIINNNASSSIYCNNDPKERRAQMRQETVYQESGFKQFAFNAKTQHQGGDSRLLQKIQTLSYTSIINDADNALQVDSSFIKRLEHDTEQLSQAISSSHKFIQEWTTQYNNADEELLVSQKQFDFLFNMQDMAKEKVPLLFKAFDELTDVIDEYRTLVSRNLNNAAGSSYDDLNQQYGEIHQGEALFLLADYTKALHDVFADVDEAYTNVEVIVNLAQTYFVRQSIVIYIVSNHINKESMTKYVSEIAYPFFKCMFLKTYLKYYVRASHDELFEEDLFAHLNIDQSILCHMVLQFSKTTLTNLIQMNMFQTPLIQSLLAQIINKTYGIAKELDDKELQRQSLNLIKLHLEHLVANNSTNCGILSYKKLQNLLLFKSLLPPRNLKECITQTSTHLKASLVHQDENSRTTIINEVTKLFKKKLRQLFQNQNMMSEFSSFFE